MMVARYCECRQTMQRFTRGIIARLLQDCSTFFAANSLHNLLLAKRRTEGFRHGRRGFAADSLQMQRKAAGGPGFPDVDELQAAAWKRPFHWPPRPRQK